ncbi:hypothetical protein TPSD3_04360 [Thioflexithrix psekupsensis]|uniref:Uncharacterized protein n=1 Tax=Thioflexithrix psekupsensis TaxID=1570016 RepID=A0A251XBR4_9GAMM|nr:hypothetical protein TPSD3_04360 [Thioflexithrix psekupsensis]
MKKLTYPTDDTLNFHQLARHEQDCVCQQTPNQQHHHSHLIRRWFAVQTHTDFVGQSSPTAATSRCIEHKIIVSYLYKQAIIFLYKQKIFYSVFFAFGLKIKSLIFQLIYFVL